MFYYRPHPPQAYQDMKDLQFVVFLGSFLRNMHRWAAHGMVICVFLHMCRVFYTGSYKRPRQFNWVIGVFLFLLTLGLSFTGYLLPWDQLAFWAITVGTNIGSYAPLVGSRVRELLLGGHTVGEFALLRFYVLHVAVLPSLVVLLTMVHFWRIRKDGGLSRPVWKLKEPNPGTAGDTSARRPMPELAAVVVPASHEKTYGLMEVVTGKPLFETVTAEEEEDTVFSYPYAFFREADRTAGDGRYRDGRFALLERAAGRTGQPGQDAESGQGAVVLSGAAGTGEPFRTAGRRGGAGPDGPGAGRDSLPGFEPQPPARRA